MSSLRGHLANLQVRSQCRRLPPWLSSRRAAAKILHLHCHFQSSRNKTISSSPRQHSQTRSSWIQTHSAPLPVVLFQRLPLSSLTVAKSLNHGRLRTMMTTKTTTRRVRTMTSKSTRGSRNKARLTRQKQRLVSQTSMRIATRANQLHKTQSRYRAPSVVQRSRRQASVRSRS